MYCNATHPLHKEPLNRRLAKVDDEECGQEHLQHNSHLGQIAGAHYIYPIVRLTITFKLLRFDELRYPEQLALATLVFLISFSIIILLYLVCKVF